MSTVLPRWCWWCCCLSLSLSLSAVRSQVGPHDAEEAKGRVVKEMLSAIKGACEACARQGKEERDGFRAQIQQAKVSAPACHVMSCHERVIRDTAVRCHTKTTTTSFQCLFTPPVGGFGHQRLRSKNRRKSMSCGGSGRFALPRAPNTAVIKTALIVGERLSGGVLEGRAKIHVHCTYSVVDVGCQVCRMPSFVYR